MQREDTPKSMDEMLLALADGELDFGDQPQVLAKIAEDPKAAHRLAHEQRLKQACARVMDGPEMKCPNELAGKVLALAGGGTTVKPATASATAPKRQAPYTGPPVIAKIGRWVPTAIAAVLLLAAGVLFNQANTGGSGAGPNDFLTVSDIKTFTGRHFDCAERPDRLKNPDQFSQFKDFEQLPGKLGDYFKTDADKLSLNLGGIGYEYQLTGTCALPGSGAVHIVYHKQQNPDQSISVWIVAADKAKYGELEEGRVYSEVGEDLLKPVIFWRDGGLLYYLVGDSIEDCDKAVQTLRQAV